MENNQRLPLTLDNLAAMPKLICIVDTDTNSMENAIGYVDSAEDINIAFIYREAMEKLDLSFYPNRNSEVYYADPCVKNNYIALDEYYNYLKTARVDELQKIAMALGAKHFRVTYRDTESISAGELIPVTAENIFHGHEPTIPVLQYWKKETVIQTLISMRMSGQTVSQRLTLNLGSSSGIKESDAAKIDAALKAKKVPENLSMATEARNESHRYLEYEIDF